MRARTLVGGVLLSLLCCASIAHAADRPIDALRLKLKEGHGKKALVFLSRDPSFLVPAIGSADDPALAGMTVYLLLANQASYTFNVPSGSGDPGWSSEPGPPPRYKFKNAAAPAGIATAQRINMTGSKILKVLLKDGVDFNLGQPLGSVGIRITTGALRNCALFDGPTIRKDTGYGVFVAANATAASMQDCSDVALHGGAPAGPCESGPYPTCGGSCAGDGVCALSLFDFSCRCVSPSSPCGGTSPLCNGTCDAGEECVALGPGPYPTYPSCACLPQGSTPCGTPGAPVCGGACPADEVCRPEAGRQIFGGQLGCDCALPEPCGQGGLDCPNGTGCGQLGYQIICAPIPCGGSPTYPTCGGGTCVDGAVCQPVAFNDSNEFCVCAIPASCDATCGGYTCPDGEVCRFDSGATCSCSAP